MNQKRTQRDRRETTRTALLAAARQLFGSLGYESTYLDRVVAEAGVTKGALYHHFPNGKPQLFESVLMIEQQRMMDAISSVSVGSGAGEGGHRRRLSVYFDYAVEPGVHRITMEDAPAVLGLKRWREIEYLHSARLIEADLSLLIESGQLACLPVEMLAATIYGACGEATIMIAQSKNKKRAKEDAMRVIVALLNGLRADHPK